MTQIFFPFQKHRLAVLWSLFLCLPFLVSAQNTSNHGNKFEAIDPMIPGPNNFRGMDGAPGPDYWQQQCDYDIDARLNVEEQRLDGKETLTYYNNSPNTLKYFWMQLDENQFSKDNYSHRFDPSTIAETMSELDLQALEAYKQMGKHGVNIEAVTDTKAQPLTYRINNTMMRVELPKPLAPGEKFSFVVKWHYYIVDRVVFSKLSGYAFSSYPRGGYEYFPDDGNYLFTITQWYPRMCAYTDLEGWQNQQFTGRSEFALTFGDFDVRMTVPADYMVGSTGECQNYDKMLTSTQMSRYRQAETAKEPVKIVTLEEATALESAPKTKETKTWIYRAENVRDFAWTASRKFIWDAMPHITEAGKRVMCMSYYGKEAYPIYERYSTKAVAQTLETYSKFSFPYPYPVAISVEAANGMEYPMICFNPGRAEKDGTYTEAAKNACISIVIHEVGHNYFPMIINSDERQWTWMDEGLNSFVQFLAESEFDNKYNSNFGASSTITDYMKMPKEMLEPIMTHGDNQIGFGPNSYTKPAAGLNILRETVMGRELFDLAFKEYCQRWMFKNPSPADFFRTMEDASGVDLDWFWRGWFYSIDATDISLDSIKWYKVDLKKNPKKETKIQSTKIEQPKETYSQKLNRESGREFTIDNDPELRDFYTEYKPWETEDSIQTQTTLFHEETFTKKEKKELFGDKNYYELHFSNKGGLVMPVIIEWTFEDGTKEIERVPVQIWRKNENNFTKVFVKDKEVKAIIIDPYQETADIDESNNNWPVKELPSRFQVFKKHVQEKAPNAMQKSKKLIKP